MAPLLHIGHNNNGQGIEKQLFRNSKKKNSITLRSETFHFKSNYFFFFKERCRMRSRWKGGGAFLSRFFSAISAEKRSVKTTKSSWAYMSQVLGNPVSIPLNLILHHLAEEVHIILIQCIAIPTGPGRPKPSNPGWRAS